MSKPAQKYDSPLPMPDALFDEQIERVVIGSVLINPSLFSSLDGILEGYTDFYLERHKWLWSALQSISARNEPFEYHTIRREMEAAGVYKPFGGDLYLTDLFNCTSSAVYGEQYARLLARDARRRRLLEVGHEIQQITLSRDLSVEEIYDAAVRAVDTAYGVKQEGMPLNASELSSKWLGVLDERLTRPHGFTDSGLLSGFRLLDQLVSFERGNLVFVAGRPGMGKTALLLKMQLNAIRIGTLPRTLYYTLEMSETEVHGRRVKMLSGVDPKRITTVGKEYDAILKAAGQLSDFGDRLLTDDRPSLTTKTIDQHLTLYARQDMKVDVVFLDYIGLMDGDNPRDDERIKLSKISKRLKELAKKHDCLIVSGAQLNREVEKRKDKRPTLSDLRDSGSLEQDSDTVILLYRDVVYNEGTENPNLAELIVAKQRDGATDTIPLYFDPTLTNFVDGTLQTIDTSAMDMNHQLERF